jgi:dTDP-L-rhamnose 4-epimerase
LDVSIEPLAREEFRPGEIRHLISDTQRVAATGFSPHVTLERGIERYLDWIRTQGDVKEYFASAEATLRSAGIVQKAASKAQS